VKYFFLVFSILFCTNIYSQGSDSLAGKNKQLKFEWKQLIIPTVLIGYGVVGLDNEKIQEVNTDVNQVFTGNVEKKTAIDDFLVFVPSVSVYALNLAGIQGNNNFRDRTIILSTAFLIASGTVLTLKSVTNVQRPDGSSYDSFPSGHTAIAFMGAEFLWQEFKNVSIVYGLSGYIIAAGTGFFRMYNNRHWFTDVAAGAGIGILSTKIAYWIHPFINSKIFKSEKSIGMNFLTPIITNKNYGLSFIKQF
jgi:hypothetical protein